MECPFPQRIKIRKPLHAKCPDLKFELYVTVPCGQCLYCRMKIAKEWRFRCESESKASNDPHYFITLTYGDKINGINSYYSQRANLRARPCESDGSFISRRDFQLFIFRMRIACQRAGFKYKLRYFGIGEYGPARSERAHYHILFFNVPMGWFDFRELVRRCWCYGRIDVKDANVKAINYISKYTAFIAPYRRTQHKPFRTSCQRPCLGFSWLQSAECALAIRKKSRTVQRSVNIDGKTQLLTFAIPRYFTRKYLEPLGFCDYKYYERRKNEEDISYYSVHPREYVMFDGLYYPKSYYEFARQCYKKLVSSKNRRSSEQQLPKTFTFNKWLTSFNPLHSKGRKDLLSVLGTQIYTQQSLAE